MSRAAFFDLDGTLLDCNSARLWLVRELRGGRVSVRDAAWAAGWLVAYGMGYGEIEEIYRQAAATLAGQSEAEIEARTASWFREEVIHRLRLGAAAALHRHRRAGDRLVLATSSSIYAAREAAAAFGLDDLVATEFVVQEGRFTGELHSPAVGPHKATRVRAWAAAEGFDLADAAFYTDSTSDLDLLELVGEPVVVHPDPRLRRIALDRGWPIRRWDAVVEAARR